MPDEVPVATRIKGIIHSAKVDKEGQWMLTLAVPKSNGPQVAALALYTETVFDIDFRPDAESTQGAGNDDDRM